VPTFCLLEPFSLLSGNCFSSISYTAHAARDA
jgi:hypothetical protein